MLGAPNPPPPNAVFVEPKAAGAGLGAPKSPPPGGAAGAAPKSPVEGAAGWPKLGAGGLPKGVDAPPKAEGAGDGAPKYLIHRKERRRERGKKE